MALQETVNVWLSFSSAYCIFIFFQPCFLAEATTLASYQLLSPSHLNDLATSVHSSCLQGLCVLCVCVGMILVSEIMLIVFRVKLIPLISPLRECFGRGGTWTRHGIFFVLPLLASG